MARKASSTARRSSKKVAVVAFSALALAGHLGYDPCLLLPAPAGAAEIITVPASGDSAHLHAFAESFASADLSPPEPVLLIEAAAEASADPVESFRALYAGIEPGSVSDAMFTVRGRFADRASYEADKNPDNDNIHRTLRKAKEALTRDPYLRVLLACEADDGFIDRSLRQGAAYNVYAIDKLQDLVGFLAGNPSLNRINGAVLRTMIAFEEAGVDFDMGIAKAAASDKIRVEARLRPLMRSHTVSASTAPTQASSTMQALVTLGIVVSTGSSGSKNAGYRFADTPQARAIKARLA